MKKVKLKVNYINLAIIFLGLLIVFYFCSVAKIDFLAKDISDIEIKDVAIEPIKSDNLSRAEGEVSFRFVPKRNNVSGIVLYGYKYNYIYFEESASVSLEISYQKDNLKNYCKKYNIPLQKFRGKIFKINFEPLEKCKDRPVLVKIVSSQDLATSRGIHIKNDDSTKILYKINSKESLGEIINNINEDSRFFKIYGLILVPLIAFILFLLVFNFENEIKKQKIRK